MAEKNRLRGFAIRAGCGRNQRVNSENCARSIAAADSARWRPHIGPMPRRDFTPTPGRHALQMRFLHAIRAGATPPEAAVQAGAQLATFYTWRRRNPSFRQAWKKARAHARVEKFPLPKAAPAPRAENPPKRLTVVVRSFTPGIPDRHILMERRPDGRTVTVRQWDEFPAPDEHPAEDADAQ